MKHVKFAIYALVALALVGIILRWKKSPATNTNKVSNVTNPAIMNVTYALPIVNYTDKGFEPAELKVRLGAKVVWNNLSSKDIEVNSSKHPTHEDYPQLNLNKVAPKGSVSLIFNEPGTFKYHNHLNPSQTGTIKVE